MTHKEKKVVEESVELYLGLWLGYISVAAYVAKKNFTPEQIEMFKKLLYK